MDEAARQAAQRAGFTEEQVNFLETIFRHNEGLIHEMCRSHEGAVAVLTQLLQKSFTATRAPSFEVDAKLGKPMHLEKNNRNYEDFAFKFRTHVAQQDAVLADDLKRLEKADATPVLMDGLAMASTRVGRCTTLSAWSCKGTELASGRTSLVTHVGSAHEFRLAVENGLSCRETEGHLEMRTGGLVRAGRKGGWSTWALVLVCCVAASVRSSEGSEHSSAHLGRIFSEDCAGMDQSVRGSGSRYEAQDHSPFSCVTRFVWSLSPFQVCRAGMDQQWPA